MHQIHNQMVMNGLLMHPSIVELNPSGCMQPKRWRLLLKVAKSSHQSSPTSPRPKIYLSKSRLTSPNVAGYVRRLLFPPPIRGEKSPRRVAISGFTDQGDEKAKRKRLSPPSPRPSRLVASVPALTHCLPLRVILTRPCPMPRGAIGPSWKAAIPYGRDRSKRGRGDRPRLGGGVYVYRPHPQIFALKSSFTFIQQPRIMPRCIARARPLHG